LETATDLKLHLPTNKAISNDDLRICAAAKIRKFRKSTFRL
jgi:hypothetical protein